MDKKNIKEILFGRCLDFVNQRIGHIQQAINEATEAGNDETKNTSGDKHETGRAQMHLEQEKNSRQLSEALLLRDHLLKIKYDSGKSQGGAGSLILTDQGNFFIAIAVGKLQIEDDSFFVISPVSPLGNALMNRKKGEEFLFNNKNYRIQEIL